MTNNPIYNALVATGYVSLVVLIINYGVKLVGEVNSILLPIVMLSLFVISAAIMGYVFCFQPIQLFLDGKKTEGVSLFLKTIAYFAVVTIIIFVITYFTTV